MARTPHEPTSETRRQVRLMASFGLSARQIAQVVGVSRTTVGFYYRTEVAIGAMHRVARMAHAAAGGQQE